MPRRDWYCEDVLSGKVEVKRIWEDDRVLAFYNDFKPEARVHVLLIPKEHLASVLDSRAIDGALLKSLVQAIQAVAQQTGLDKIGFSVRTNAAGQNVTPHMHWHIMSFD